MPNPPELVIDHGHRASENHTPGEFDALAAVRHEIAAPAENKEKQGDKIGPIRPGESTLESITLPNGEKANYRLHVPEGYDGKTALPVVLMFHGYGRNRGQGDTEKGAEGMEEVSALSKLADKEGFIAVYPDGNANRSYSWNNGQWFFSKRNDVAFTSGMMDTIDKHLNVDKERIYIMGYSQGGSFSHNVANKLSNRVAAVVENGGWMTGKENQPASAFPIMSIQSLSDSVSPAEGSQWYNVKMQPETYTQDFYKKANGITEAPNISTRTGKDGSEVVDYSWKNPKTGAEVRTMYLNNQKHLWYGGVGAEDAPINATAEAWKFLKQFRKEQAP